MEIQRSSRDVLGQRPDHVFSTDLKIHCIKTDCGNRCS
jgi:hypothetical protein